MHTSIPSATQFLWAASGALSLSASPLFAKSIIQLGWDQPNTEFVRDHWQELEKAPFDGITIEVSFTHDGKLYNDYSVMSRNRWPRKALKPALENLKAAKFNKLKHNFIRVNSTPGDLDWFNDEDWDAACSNIANIAWLAKESGMKGILFDTETYNNFQYMWKPASGRSYAETSAKARERGAQVMKALTKEFPDITILSLWLLSKAPLSTQQGDTESAITHAEYGLWPAVVNGWLDALPETARIVEGMEDAYYFQRMEEFSSTYAMLRSANSSMISKLLAPENRKKYQTQVSISFGVYLDAYLDAPSSGYYLKPLDGGTSLNRLRDTLVKAKAYADDYVWVYNEQVRWWPIETPTWQEGGRFLTSSRKRPGKGEIAEKAFPGISQAIDFARVPIEVADQILKGKSATELRDENLLKNGYLGDADQKEGVFSPRHWWTWKHKTSGVEFGWDGNMVRRNGGKGAARIKGLGSGTFAQTISAKPGEHYAVEAHIQQDNDSPAHIVIRWRTANGKWNNLVNEVAIAPDPNQEGPWKRAFGVVTVPEGSDALAVLLQGSNVTKDGSTWYSDVAFYKLNP